MAASSLETMGSASRARQERLALQRSRLAETQQNRPLNEILRNRSFADTRVGGGEKNTVRAAKMELKEDIEGGASHMVGGDGLPDPEAAEAARAIGRGRKRMTKEESKAHKIGKQYGREIMSGDGEVRGLIGSGYREAFGRGLVEALVMKKGGAKKRRKTEKEEDVEAEVEVEEEMEGEAKTEDLKGGSKKRKRRKAGASDKRRSRGQMISKLMKEKGMSLGEASKYIKEHGSS